ncbi:hypothetical protein AXG93_4866s1000 [Marchantia polymorpha subsp. ruderalis]|uniref:Plant heme peroxidase family profile domain-containing protein n=1 Tax=Marchantia polymorpha subsp. ruderalis TaxID=1480154 RepID=A0A176WJ99_MARPO|nr:hypothetical protein AXG93_4866s1000 [Marchantia polymorpha subsp. ruderalis]
MDSTKNTFDHLYFKAVLNNKGLFQSDANLLTNPVGKELVTRYSKAGSSFSSDFAAAMTKMSNIQWATDGEAGRDPIFFSHHANVDHLWNVWKALPDNISDDRHRIRKDYDDFDFLETEFTFYEENKDMVIVKVKDTLDTRQLGYRSWYARFDVFIDFPKVPEETVEEEFTHLPTSPAE